MRLTTFCAAAITALLPYTTAQDIPTTESLLASAARIAGTLKSTYPNPSLALLPQPYWWWESGSAIDALLSYGVTTGDRQYESLLANTLLNQATAGNDFMTADATGNDDQAWWALAAMTAAESGVVSGGVPLLTLAQNVFNEQKARWDMTKCGGGLKWKINVGNGQDGYHYKSIISNGLFFQLAARLARFTNDADALSWAEKAYDWVTGVGLIDSDFNVFDGTDDTKGENGCAEVNENQWSYNTGVFLYGAAVMAAHTGDTKWIGRTSGLVASAQRSFVRDGSLFEARCEGVATCNTDQVSFKGTLARWMGAAAAVLPDVRASISETMDLAAAKLQSNWNSALGVMDHFVDLEVMDAAVRARADEVALMGLIGVSKSELKMAKRGIAGRTWWEG